MKLPFSIEDFLNIFERYNLSMWPAQAILFLLAIACVFAIIRKTKTSLRIVFSILGFLWLWMGVVYHILFFSTINPAAWIFGLAFVLQGFLFIYLGAMRQKIDLKIERGWSGVLGYLLIIFSLIIYPLLGLAQGRAYPQMPTFGVPCPTTIFTFGLLLFSVNRIPWYVILIPILWSLIGFSAALNLQIKEDYGLVLAGMLFVIVQYFFKKKNTIQNGST